MAMEQVNFTSTEAKYAKTAIKNSIYLRMQWLRLRADDSMTPKAEKAKRKRLEAEVEIFRSALSRFAGNCPRDRK